MTFDGGQKLVFLDIETSGLDPKLDHVLEIYACAVDAKTFKVRSEFHGIIAADMAAVRARADEWVLETHTRTGLFAAIEDWKEGQPNKPEPLEDTMHELRRWLLQWGRGIFAGRNVGTFDRVFLENSLPGFAAKMSHQNFDVSTVLNAFKFWGGADVPAMPEKPGLYHRADVDVKHDIECMTLVADWIEDAPGE